MDVLQEMKRRLLSGNGINIVFIGDSITSTEWVHPNWREIVEYVLKEELTRLIGNGNWQVSSWGIRCFNYGFDGSTTLDVLDRMDSILACKPYMAVYLENTNEIHYDVTPEQHRGNLERLFRGLSKSCRYIVACNSICGNNAAYNRRVRKYSYAFPRRRFKSKVLFIDTFRLYARYDLKRFFTFKSDGNEFLGLKRGDIDFVHPNQLGNAYIAKLILEKAFDIGFDAEKYMRSTRSGDMFPGY